MYARETDGAIISAGHDRRAAFGPPMGPTDSSYREFSRSKNLRSNRTESRFAAARRADRAAARFYTPPRFSTIDEPAGWIISRGERLNRDSGVDVRRTRANSRRLRHAERTGARRAETRTESGGTVDRSPLADAPRTNRVKTATKKRDTRELCRVPRRELTRDWDLVPRARAIIMRESE